MNKSTFRCVQSVFMFAIVLLFGFLISLIIKQQEEAQKATQNETTIDVTNGEQAPENTSGGLKQIGFQYGSDMPEALMS